MKAFTEFFEKTAFKTDDEPTKIASHRSMIGANYCIDLKNKSTRNKFIQLYQETAFWKRSLDVNYPFNYNAQRIELISYLMEVAPESESNFYLDIDSMQIDQSDPNQQKSYMNVNDLIEKAWEWTNLYVNQQSRHRIKMIVYKSEKVSKKNPTQIKNRFHIHWPNFVIDNPINRQRLAKDFQRFCSLKKMDLSVYCTGLRLPGFLKRNQVEFYSWYPTRFNPNPPQIEDIIICPSIDEPPLEFNSFTLVQALTNPLNYPIVVAKKKQHQTVPNVVLQVGAKAVSWSGVLDPSVLKSVEQLTQYKPPYKVVGKARLINSWFIDFKRGPDSLCVHGQQHDSWKFVLNHFNQRIRIMCMKPECRSKGWIDICSTIASKPQSNDDLPPSDDIQLDEEDNNDDNEQSNDQLSFNYLIHCAEKDKLDHALRHMNDYMGLLTKPLAIAHRIDGGKEWELAKNTELSLRFDIDFNIKSESSKSKKKNILKLWMSWRHVRRFTKIVFDPKLSPTQKWIPKELKSVKDQHSEVLNLWKGFQVEPSKIENHDELIRLIQPLIDHIFRIWCRNDEHVFDWIMKIFAWIFQKPWEKTNVGVILQSEQGAGKNIVFDCLKKIIGDHMITVSNMDAILSSFNDHISNGVMLILDEVIYNNSSLQAQNLKRLITEESMEVRPKYHSTYYVKSCLNCFILSTKTKVIKMEPGCYRWAVLHLSNESKNLFSGYWKGKQKSDEASIWDNIKLVQPQNILQYFLSIDISKFDPTDVPITKERIFQMLENLQQDEAWFFYLTKEEPQWFNNQPIDSSKVWESFKSFVRLNGSRCHKIDYCKESFFDIIKKKFLIHTKRAKIRTNSGSFLRKYVTTFPLINVAKDAFSRFMNVGDFQNVYEILDHK